MKPITFYFISLVLLLSLSPFRSAFHFDCAKKRNQNLFSFHLIIFSFHPRLESLFLRFSFCVIIHFAQIIMTEPIITSHRLENEKKSGELDGEWWWSEWQKIGLRGLFLFASIISKWNSWWFKVAKAARRRNSNCTSARLITWRVKCTRCLIKIISSPANTLSSCSSQRRIIQ